MPSNLNVSAERSLSPPQPHDHHLISGVLIGDQIIRDLISEIGVLFFYFLLIRPCKSEKQKTKERLFKTFTAWAEAQRGKKPGPTFLFTVWVYTQIYNSRQIDLRVRQEEKKKKNSAQTLVCSASTFRWLHIKNMALEPRVKGEASARFSEWEALKVPRWRNYFQL